MAVPSGYTNVGGTLVPTSVATQASSTTGKTYTKEESKPAASSKMASEVSTSTTVTPSGVQSSGFVSSDASSNPPSAGSYTGPYAPYTPGMPTAFEQATTPSTPGGMSPAEGFRQQLAVVQASPGGEAAIKSAVEKAAAMPQTTPVERSMAGQQAYSDISKAYQGEMLIQSRAQSAVGDLLQGGYIVQQGKFNEYGKVIPGSTYFILTQRGAEMLKQVGGFAGLEKQAYFGQNIDIVAKGGEKAGSEVVITREGGRAVIKQGEEDIKAFGGPVISFARRESFDVGSTGSVEGGELAVQVKTPSGIKTYGYSQLTVPSQEYLSKRIAEINKSSEVKLTPAVESWRIPLREKLATEKKKEDILSELSIGTGSMPKVLQERVSIAAAAFRARDYPFLTEVDLYKVGTSSLPEILKYDQSVAVATFSMKPRFSGISGGKIDMDKVSGFTLASKELDVAGKAFTSGDLGNIGDYIAPRILLGSWLVLPVVGAASVSAVPEFVKYGPEEGSKQMLVNVALGKAIEFGIGKYVSRKITTTPTSLVAKEAETLMYSEKYGMTFAKGKVVGPFINEDVSLAATFFTESKGAITMTSGQTEISFVGKKIEATPFFSVSTSTQLAEGTALSRLSILGKEINPAALEYMTKPVYTSSSLSKGVLGISRTPDIVSLTYTMVPSGEVISAGLSNISKDTSFFYKGAGKRSLQSAYESISFSIKSPTLRQELSKVAGREYGGAYLRELGFTQQISPISKFSKVDYSKIAAPEEISITFGKTLPAKTRPVSFTFFEELASFGKDVSYIRGKTYLVSGGEFGGYSNVPDLYRGTSKRFTGGPILGEYDPYKLASVQKYKEVLGLPKRKLLGEVFDDRLIDLAEYNKLFGKRGATAPSTIKPPSIEIVKPTIEPFVKSTQEKGGKEFVERVTKGGMIQLELVKPLKSAKPRVKVKDLVSTKTDVARADTISKQISIKPGQRGEPKVKQLLEGSKLESTIKFKEYTVIKPKLSIKPLVLTSTKLVYGSVLTGILPKTATLTKQQLSLVGTTSISNLLKSKEVPAQITSPAVAQRVLSLTAQVRSRTLIKRPPEIPPVVPKTPPPPPTFKIPPPNIRFRKEEGGPLVKDSSSGGVRVKESYKPSYFAALFGIRGRPKLGKGKFLTGLEIRGL